MRRTPGFLFLCYLKRSPLLSLSVTVLEPPSETMRWLTGMWFECVIRCNSAGWYYNACKEGGSRKRNTRNNTWLNDHRKRIQNPINWKDNLRRLDRCRSKAVGQMNPSIILQRSWLAENGRQNGCSVDKLSSRSSRNQLCLCLKLRRFRGRLVRFAIASTDISAKSELSRKGYALMRNAPEIWH